MGLISLRFLDNKSNPMCFGGLSMISPRTVYQLVVKSSWLVNIVKFTRTQWTVHHVLMDYPWGHRRPCSMQILCCPCHTHVGPTCKLERIPQTTSFNTYFGIINYAFANILAWGFAIDFVNQQHHFRQHFDKGLCHRLWHYRLRLH